MNYQLVVASSYGLSTIKIDTYSLLLKHCWENWSWDNSEYSLSHYPWPIIYLNSAALELLPLETLKFRRNYLSLKFAIKSEKDEKFKFWFKANSRKVNTRQQVSKYCPVIANHARFDNSPLSFLTKLLNMHHSK